MVASPPLESEQARERAFSEFPLFPLAYWISPFDSLHRTLFSELSIGKAYKVIKLV